MSKKHMKNTKVDTLNTENSPTKDENVIAKYLIHFFSKVSKMLTSKITNNPDFTLKLDTRENLIFLKPTTRKEVFETIKSLKKKAANWYR